MKKETIYAFLDKKEQEVRKLEDQSHQPSLLEAISNCRTWVKRPWATMAEPVSKQVRVIQQEVVTLLEKEQREPLSQAEQIRQTELCLLYAIVYQPFQQKIYPTVLKARLERKKQARQKAERAQHTSEGAGK